MAGFLFVVVSTCLYVGAAVSFCVQRNWPLAVMYIGYSFANIGCLVLAWPGRPGA